MAGALSQDQECSQQHGICPHLRGRKLDHYKLQGEDSNVISEQFCYLEKANITLANSWVGHIDDLPNG